MNGGLMGLFKSQIEKELERIYVPMLTAVSPNRGEAKKRFNQILEEAKIKCKEYGITENRNWSENLIKLMNSTNTQINIEDKFFKDRVDYYKKYIDVRKKEGVIESDIRSWWDLHYLERAFIQELDNSFRLVAALINREKGLSGEESAKLIRRIFITYGDPNDTSHAIGDNRPLPYELKDRINKYIEKRTRENPTAFKNEIQNYETYNALIRAEIKKGNI